MGGVAKPPPQAPPTKPSPPRPSPHQAPDERHAAVKAAMQPYRKKFGKSVLRLRSILAAMDKKDSDLPAAPPEILGDKRAPCLQHVLQGRCRFGDKCTFAHPTGDTIPEGYATDLCKFLAPGLAWVVEHEVYERRGKRKAGQ